MRSASYKYKWALTEIRKGTPLIKMFEQGLTTDEVKGVIINILEPYFENQDILGEFAISALLPEAVVVARISNDDWAIEMLIKCLTTYRQAKSISVQANLKACVFWVPATMQGLSIHWNQLHLERDKNTLALEEFAHECLQNIGSIIEGAAKPYLKALLHQVRITRSENIDTSQIDGLGLGEVVNELARKTDYQELFAPPPWNIRLNQWRNIAQHLSTEIQGDQVICRYGTSNNLREIALSRAELLEAITTIYIAYTALKTSHSIYFVDNIQITKSLGLLPKNLAMRPEMELLNFSLVMASQGFELVDFQWNEEEAIAIIKDVSKIDAGKRRIHTTQFPFVLWQHTNTKYATIEYREQDGTPNLRSRINEEYCLQVQRGEIPFEELANRVELTDLKTGAVFRSS